LAQVLVYSIFPKTESTLFSSRNNGLWRSTSIPRAHMRGESSRKGQPGLNSREAADFGIFSRKGKLALKRTMDDLTFRRRRFPRV